MPREDTIRTRKSLLDAACEIFARKGFRDTTIAEISKRAGTNIAAVNYHFSSKETLYVEAWRRAFQESVKELPLFLHVFLLVKVPPLLSSVNQEPLLFGGDLFEAFQRPAQMEPLIRPARHYECRHLYL